MATVYTVQTPPHAGTAPLTSTTPAASGDTLPTGAGIALFVVQTGTTGSTLTLPVPQTDGLNVTSRTVTIPTTTGSLTVVPLPTYVYGATVSPTWSSVTGLNTYVVSNGA